MYAIGPILRKLREEIGLQLAAAQEQSGIEMTVLSRIETGKRLPTVEQVQRLALVYQFDEKKLLVQRESDRIVTTVESPEVAIEALQVATDKITYGQQYLPMFQDAIYDKPISLESRRYIGSKAKLTDWIMDVIDSRTNNIHCFCDIFAGTATVANRAFRKYDKVIINDFLYSNNVIYKAFFGEGDWNKEKLCQFVNRYNSLNTELLADNWFSDSYGGKYYEYKLSKQIGHIRQDIEDSRESLTEKEYCILLASLIYSIDKLANTVGHFDAYIKKPIKQQQFSMRLVDAHSFSGAEIFREDANALARRIHSDLVYIDPPYNSRQYSRFYHVYETLVKWDRPELFGVARKPAPENVSAYCSTRAVDAFRDLVTNLDTRYIVVSYNNTYNSKSHSSENKILLQDIESILSAIGETEVLEHSHKFFNAGKTEFDDHKELLFVTRVK